MIFRQIDMLEVNLRTSTKNKLVRSEQAVEVILLVSNLRLSIFSLKKWMLSTAGEYTSGGVDYIISLKVLPWHNPCNTTFNLKSHAI